MRILIKDDAGYLKEVEVFEGDIINLSTGEVESSKFVAYILLDKGPALYECFCAEVNPHMTIMDLKGRIQTLTGIPSEQQTLKRNGKVLEMWMTLGRYGMVEAPVYIDLIVRDLFDTPSSDIESDSS